jgi:hypothetical protein
LAYNLLVEGTESFIDSPIILNPSIDMIKLPFMYTVF